MKPSMGFARLLLGVLLMMICSGCGDKQDKTASAKIDALEKEVTTLTALLEDANKKLEAVGVDDRVTKDDCREIKTWADELVKSLGQGIWYPGENVYPVFVKPVKTGSAETLIDEINKKFRADKLPEVIFLSSEKAKVVVGVSDDNQLTSGLGSEGAKSYMNAVTFTLCSIPGVSSVEFKFEEGDHAVPGTYQRNFIIKNHKP